MDRILRRGPVSLKIYGVDEELDVESCSFLQLKFRVGGGSTTRRRGWRRRPQALGGGLPAAEVSQIQPMLEEALD